ncbi:polysaccharide pyruvyl transferase family protein [Nitratireductor sp. GISD-1A_MAKvit]|uniref:polysaccharide pyruvyl transferase family protein n=1 Tax=Nitratireductor sp. GISD-1A_MAKvit TaxID=3234198 RepID=UPI00346717BB
MKIVIFNVRYSPNLGDGILAECLERQLGIALPGARIETVDLAGRTAYGAQDARRSQALRLLQTMPPPIRRMVVERAIGSRLAVLRTLWRRKISRADAVIIGGGNLFQDDDLNFPLKIAQVLELCREEQRPVGIFAVGVSRAWSRRAANLFGRLQACDVFHVSVRDDGAMHNWRMHFSEGPEASIAPDPALTLAGRAHRGRHRERPVVGLCVTHPLVLQRHGGGAGRGHLLGTMDGYRALAEGLVDAGCDVLFFTNGAVEDASFLDRIRHRMSAFASRNPGRCTFAPRPVAPRELVALVSSLDAMAGHRLHACISAYALNVPPVGIGWDQKVESFFRLVGREPFFVSAHTGSVRDIRECVLAAVETGLDSERRRQCMQAAAGSIVRLADSLSVRIEERNGQPA